MSDTSGSLVASENLIVKISPSENIASGASGSAAVNFVIAGPLFLPKSPSKGSDKAVEGNDVPAWFRKLPPSFS